jgi:hypothetical protein
VQDLAELSDRHAQEVRSKNSLFLALSSSDQFVDPDHLDSISRLDSINQISLKNDSDGLRKEARRGHFRQLLNDNALNIPKRAHAVLKTEWVAIVIMSLYKASFGGLEIFFRIQIIRVFLYFEGLGLFAVVYTLLELMLWNLHLRYDSLDTHQFICQFAPQATRSYKIGA